MALSESPARSAPRRRSCTGDRDRAGDRRGQRVGQLSELSRRVRCPPPSGVARGFLERSGDAVVGARRREREVANATLLVVDHVGEPPVRIASLAVRRDPGHRRREQRVSEPHHAPVDLDDPTARLPRSRALSQPSPNAWASASSRGCASREARRSASRADLGSWRARCTRSARSRRERGGALRGQAVSQRRQAPARARARRTGCPRTLVKTNKERAWQRETELVGEHSLDRTDAERADVESFYMAISEQLGQLWRRHNFRFGSHRSEEPDRLHRHATYRKAQCPRRHEVEPLQIVDGDDQRLIPGDGSEQ